MVPALDPETHARHWQAHGGHGTAVVPHEPNNSLSRDWRPGLACHWQERTAASRRKSLLLRVVLILQLAASVSYLQFRARRTIGVFASSRLPGWAALQILFFCYEIVISVFPLFHAFEVWNVVMRNAVDFKRIPNHMIQSRFRHDEALAVPPQYSNYPAIQVIIPCYKEDTPMVTQVVHAALALDYPPQLLSVYLCDDGNDDTKADMVARLQPKHPHLHYVTRPNNLHAKPGNVNYTLSRTESDLVVQLDADFIARPFLIQRLLSYYFVWNEETSLYEFNDTLAFVQTPQHYRNLSPHDSDFLDQRNIFFFAHILPGKDWFNTSTMIGTANLLNRTALNEANNFPYHSVGDDTALSLIFHGLRYRSYFVTESVATGLVPPSLRGNLAQRSRWYRSDWQILLSKHGPLTQSGLTVIQRFIYMSVILFRLQGILQIFFDVLLILVLVADFVIVDVTDTRLFLIYLSPHLLMPIVYRIVECGGSPGIFKSVAASETFESVFKYSTLKGLLQTTLHLNRGWKAAEKTLAREPGTTVAGAQGQGDGMVLDGAVGEGEIDDDILTYEADEDGLADEERRDMELDREVRSIRSLRIDGDNDGGPPSIATASSIEITIPTYPDAVATPLPVTTTSSTSASVGDGGGSTTSKEGVSPLPGGAAKARVMVDVVVPTQEGAGGVTPSAWRAKVYWRLVGRNLRRCWFNVVFLVAMGGALITSVVRRPNLTRSGDSVVVVDGVSGSYVYSNAVALALAWGYGLSNCVPHVLVLVLCLKRRYLSGWLLADVVNGRCDEWAVRPARKQWWRRWTGRGGSDGSGKWRGELDERRREVFVPRSWITSISAARLVLIVACLAVSIGGSGQRGEFVPSSVDEVVLAVRRVVRRVFGL